MSQTDKTAGGTTSGNGGGMHIATTKVSENGTTTIPSDIRKSKDIGHSDRVEWHVLGGELVLRPATPPTISLTVLEEYEGETCPDCESGTLVRTQYDGTDAVECNMCETIRGQLWDTSQ